MPSPETEIMKVWDFDNADLSANRLGQLTEKQKNTLAEMAKNQKSFNSIIGIIIAVVFGGALLTGLATPILATLGGSFLKSGSIEPEAILTLIPFLCMGLFFLIVFGGILIVVIRVVFQRANRKVDTIIRRAEGKVNFIWVEKQVRRTGNSGPRYRTVRSLEMRVGSDNTFNNVNESLPSLINQGEEWVFYHVNHPFKILSAEKI